MFKQSPSRNHRSKGIKVKRVLQICILLAVCFWLVYQVKHSHDKKKEYDENDAKISHEKHFDGEISKIGRKAILPGLEETTMKNDEVVEEEETGGEEEEENKQHEEEEQEEDKTEEKEDEGRGGGDDEIDERDQEKSEMGVEHEVDLQAIWKVGGSRRVFTEDLEGTFEIMSAVGSASCSVLLVLLLSASTCRAQGYTPQTPTTVPYDNRGLGSSDIALTDPRLASTANGNAPEQVNLIYNSPSSVTVRWSTGQNKVAAGTPGVTSAASGAGNCGAGLLFCPGINQCYSQGQYNCVNNFLCPSNTCLCGANTCYTSQYGCKNGSLTQNPADNAGFCPTSSSVASIVRFGTSTGLGSTASGTASSYTVNNAVTTGQTYVSGLLHSVTLTGLAANTQYYYTVGDGASSQSPTFNFKTLQAISPSFSQYRIGVFADLGLTTNSSMTVDHLVQSNSQAFINIGDFVYADNYSPNAANRWDGWYRYLQQFLSYGPMIAVEGNHEIETQLDGTTFAAYKARYGNDVSTLGGSGSPFYFSTNVPGAHVVVLGAYGADYSVGSAQYNWLQADLAKVDRTQTPFIIALSHPPVYNTYKSHYKELECMRQSFEPLLYNAGVDLILYGHVHAYERTNRVYNYLNNNCGPTHITVGDGGNSEQLQTVYVDDPSPTACPAPVASRCPTYQAADAGGAQSGFCPPKQPLWSAFREAAFGHGTLDITPSQLVWSWHRNQDGEAVVSDTITIDKGSFGGCTNHGASSG